MAARAAHAAEHTGPVVGGIGPGDAKGGVATVPRPRPERVGQRRLAKGNEGPLGGARLETAHEADDALPVEPARPTAVGGGA